MKPLLILVLVLLTQACASSLEGDVYSREEARQTMNIQWATVVSTKPVVIEGDRSNTGKLAGGLIGGAAGHGVTDSNTQALTTAVGAVVGAIAGQAVEERATRAQGMELTLKMDSTGETIVVIQEVQDVNDFVAGDRVKLVSGSGKLHATKE